MRKTTATTCKVFISHAENDRAIIDKLVDLLQTGLDLQHKDIFCSCVPGLGVQGGYDFIDVIKSKIKDSTLVIAFLSKSYFTSQFCLSELGAAWIMSKKFIPLLDSSLSYTDAKGVLSGVHILKIDNQDDMNQFADDAKKTLKSDAVMPRLVRKISDFINDYPSYKKKVKQPFGVTEIEWNAKIEELKYLDSENKAQAKKISDLEITVSELKKCKSVEDVKKVVKKQSKTPEVDEFKELINEVKRNNQFSREIAKFITFTKFHLPVKDSQYSHDDYDDAISSKYLEEGDEGLDVNWSNRKVRPFISSLESLKYFMEQSKGKAKEYVEDEYDVDFEINNGDFLKKVLEIG